MVDIETFLYIPGIKFTNLEIIDKKATFKAQATYKKARCPICGKSSHSVHSSYVRNLKDLPISEYSVSIQLKVRKFFCTNKHCKRKIFSEQPSSDIMKYSRMTSRSKDRVLDILKETSARKGSLISKAILTPVSPSTALRFVHSLSLSIVDSSVVHLGIDDWAFRKGISYGTILINMDNGKVVDLLPERNGTSLKEWLKHHSNVEIVCRDRASAYASAVKEMLPNAKQVADRFHLVKNLSDTVYEILRDDYSEIVYSAREKSDIVKTKPSGLSRIMVQKVKNNPNVQYRQETFQKVKELYKNGLGKNTIARIMGLNFRTVHKYIENNHLPQKGRSESISYQSYIHTIESGLSQGKPLMQIYQNISSKGFKGSFRSFWGKFHVYAKTKKGETNLGKQEMEKLKTNFCVLPARRIAIYLSYANIEDIPVINHKKQMKILLEKCDLVSHLRHLFISFREIIKSGDKQLFDNWLDNAYNSGKRKLRTFVNGIKMDIESVYNALTMNFNSGMVEGNVNRLKNIKRQMYGRAGLELLKRKVILSCSG